MATHPTRVRGRGAMTNPPNRFDGLEVLPVWEDEAPEPYTRRPTQFLEDRSQSILATNQSPDVGFDVSLNPYRGCEHGCIYCYARPTHEYLGDSGGLDFESRILVKHAAPELLRKELSNSRWKPRPIAMSGVTDPYQPIERRLELTRRCLEVLAEFRQPVAIVTKNCLVARDLDLLQELAAHSAVVVYLSITSLKPELARKLEPRASLPVQRLAALASLHEAGVPTGVLVAPVIPGLTDTELPAILEASKQAGAQTAGYIPLRLPQVVGPLFLDWLEREFPDRARRVEAGVREFMGGQLCLSEFGERMSGKGRRAELLNQIFEVACRRNGLSRKGPTLSIASFRRPGLEQLRLFD